MTKLSLLSPERRPAGPAAYESTATLEAAALPGVRFTIRRMSFGRRIELYHAIRELVAKLEFLEAGEDARERIEANLLATEIERLYLEWGLERIEGLQIDGVEATPRVVAERGPESLCREVVSAIRRECGLSEDERKN